MALDVPTSEGSAEGYLAELLNLKQHVFTAERSEKQAAVQALIDRVVAALGPRAADPEPDTPAARRERARRCYLRGRALDCHEDYDAGAEVELAEAVRLEPTARHWNAMGHVQWKKGDHGVAEHCFEAALEHTPNALSLRELSKMMRQVPVRSSREKGLLLAGSLERAQAAVALDITDAESWYARHT
jgi:hypothetical protein